mmetsp:Transcript_6739/g.12007  ORF Transcript_6739/g.12007 Transcript_6739/m.12007 type:complete len:215 (-) Transcript_6739:829-1473(-)
MPGSSIRTQKGSSPLVVEQLQQQRSRLPVPPVARNAECREILPEGGIVTRMAAEDAEGGFGGDRRPIVAGGRLATIVVDGLQDLIVAPPSFPPFGHQGGFESVFHLVHSLSRDDGPILSPTSLGIIFSTLATTRQNARDPPQIIIPNTIVLTRRQTHQRPIINPSHGSGIFKGVVQGDEGRVMKPYRWHFVESHQGALVGGLGGGVVFVLGGGG